MNNCSYGGKYEVCYRNLINKYVKMDLISNIGKINCVCYFLFIMMVKFH
jgi:hypothetical protein